MKDSVKVFFKKRKVVIVVGIVVVILLIILLSGDKNNVTPTHVVSAQTVTEEVKLAGKVQSNDFAELGFQVSGKVRDAAARIGDEVRRGDILVQLDTAELQADLADARARVNIQEAQIYNTGSNIDVITKQQDALVESAYQNLLSSSLVVEPSSATYTQSTPVLSGRYTGPEGFYKIIIDRDNINDGVIRVFGLEKVGDVEIEKTTQTRLGTYGLFIDFPDDISDYYDTIWYVYIPNIKSSTYVTNYNLYQDALRQRERVLDEAESELRVNDSTTSIAEAQLAQAKAAVARIQAQIADYSIRAPFDGTISAIDIKEGEIVSAGTSVVALVSDGDFEIELDVPEIDISKIKVGDTVVIKLDAFGNQDIWDGKIVAISRAESYVDGVPVYQTNVAFLVPDERIRSGMSATVEIMTQSRADVLAVPTEFIERDQDGHFVFVAIPDGDTVTSERRNIEVGLRGSDGFVEIVAGLSEGETVIKKES